MSHPNPSHDRDNEYPEDNATHSKSNHKKAFDTHGKVMGTIMDALKGKKKEVAKKMGKKGK